MKKQLLFLTALLIMAAGAWAQTNPPTDNLVMHLKADIFTTAGPVGTWTDVSTNNNHASQATEANQPVVVLNQLNGLPVVSFDGNNDVLFTANPVLGSSHQLFFLVKAPKTDQRNVLFGQWSSEATNRYVGSLHESPTAGSSQANAIKVFLDPKGHFGVENVINATDFFIVSFQKDATNYNFYVNGTNVKTEAGVPSNVEQRSFTIGAANENVHLPGRVEIAEILVYDVAITETQRKEVEAYLIQKWFPVLVYDGNTNELKSWHQKIQEGIDAADTGDIVEMAAGTYYESDITIDKQGLTLKGAGQGNTIILPDPLKVDDGTCHPTNGTAHYGILIAADDVTVQDLTVDGGDPDRGYRVGITTLYWATPNFAENTTIKDVTVTNIFYRGIVIRRNGAVTSGHKIERATVTNGGCDIQGWAILGFNANVDIIDCYVENWEQGIGTGNYAGIPSACNIEGNQVVDVTNQAFTLTLNGPLCTFDNNIATFTDPANTGTGLVTYQCEMELTNNTFTGAMYGISVGYQTLSKDKLVIGSGNVVTGHTPAVAGSIGIDVSDYSWGGTARNFTMSGTTVTNYETGIWFDPVSGMTSDAVINGNNISGNGFNLRNDLGTNINATCNWWGTLDLEEIEAKISGQVTWFPFWSSDEGPCLHKMFDVKVE